jgi:hypothetical protein
MNIRPPYRIRHLIFAVGFLTIYGCNYYKPIPKSVSTAPDTKSAQLDSLIQKTFIIHSSQGIFLMQNMHINKENKEVTATLDVVPPQNLTYINDEKGKFNYSSKTPDVLHEVHLYSDLDQNIQVGDQVVIPVEKINKIELIERDKQRSTGNTVLAVFGITIGTLAVITAIIALTKSSCPFISVYDGEYYALQGETFGGAIYPSLAREDFVPLPAAAISNEIKVQISNELKERQYTDMADLILVEHQPGDQIMISPSGQLLLVKNNIKPSSAILNSRIDMLEQISVTDNTPCSFDDLSNPSSVNELVVKFENPGENKNLSIMVDMRNSMWLDYLMVEFTSQFGSRYASWTEGQKKTPSPGIA